MERTQFTFYESFFKAISRIKKKADRAEAYDTICAYALYGKEPDLSSLSDAAAIAFELVKPNLDSARRKAENGKKGGSKSEANGKQNESKTEATAKQTAIKKEKENKKEIEIENECLKEKEKKSSRFLPPSLEEVKAYCLERKNGIDPEQFIAFYAAKGWKVGNQPMKDWKAAVITWEKRDDNRQPKPSKKMTVSSPVAPTADNLERMKRMMERMG